MCAQLAFIFSVRLSSVYKLSSAYLSSPVAQQCSLFFWKWGSLLLSQIYAGVVQILRKLLGCADPGFLLVVLGSIFTNISCSVGLPCIQRAYPTVVELPVDHSKEVFCVHPASADCRVEGCMHLSSAEYCIKGIGYKDHPWGLLFFCHKTAYRPPKAGIKLTFRMCSMGLTLPEQEVLFKF